MAAQKSCEDQKLMQVIKVLLEALEKAINMLAALFRRSTEVAERLEELSRKRSLIEQRTAGAGQESQAMHIGMSESQTCIGKHNQIRPGRLREIQEITGKETIEHQPQELYAMSERQSLITSLHTAFLCASSVTAPATTVSAILMVVPSQIRGSSCTIFSPSVQASSILSLISLLGAAFIRARISNNTQVASLRRALLLCSIILALSLAFMAAAFSCTLVTVQD